MDGNVEQDIPIPLQSMTLPSTKPLVMHGRQIRLPVRREEDVRFLTVEGTGP